MAGNFIREGGFGDRKTHTKEREHVKAEVDTGVMKLQAKELPATARS